MSSRQGVTVEVSVLGAVGVRRDGDDVDVVGPRLRRLLAALTVSNGSVVPIDRLVEIVWAGDPPEGAEKSLSTYVTRLRHALGSDRDDLITFRQPGYVIDLQQGELDSDMFDDELGRAVQHLRVADTSTARDLLTRAIRRWRGPAYAGLAEEEWARPESVRLEERRYEAREALIEARLADGFAEQAVSEAQSLVEEEPLRERSRALLMRALYASGRQAEALRVYSRYRRFLADETGLDPSHEIAELESRIAQGDRSLEGARELRGYALGERIGEGAFSVVHRALQPGIGRDVAVKVIRAELADRPDFIRRFEYEAQTVARLEHPNVVPLYDFWREPGAACLVMRWLRGGSVEEALRARGPYSRDQTLRMVGDIAGALSTAHRAGVIHRDVRPANLLLDTEGTTYLADFGIALPAAKSDDLPIVSPSYAAPEVLRGEPAGVPADVLSLGVTVFECLTGRLPFADSKDRAEIIRRQLTEPLPPVRATRTDLPSVVDDVLARATAKVAGDRYATVAAFVADLETALDGADARRLHGQAPGAFRRDVENPYVGLHAFDEHDADRFHGREALVAELVDELERCPMVVVVGPSGSGKSSVVRAGLLPAVRRGALPGSDEWFVTTMVPGSDPIDALEAALLRVAVNPPATLREQLSEPGGLLRAIRRVVPDDRARILLVVDQFEELFTRVHDLRERERFLTELAVAIRHTNSPLRVVATLRADHYDAPLRHAAMADLVTDGTVTVRPMSPDELERAITLPAASVGVELEPAIAVDLLAGVNARPSALPLLQFSLTELFERRVSGTMLVSTYHELGGLTGALAARADRIVDAGGPEDEREARRIFGRLVTLGEGVEDTRRRARRSEFGTGERTAWLLDAYVSARLLTTDRDPSTREPTIEVAHEALLRDWPRLRSWLDDDRDDLRALRAVSTAADDWARSDEDPGGLARGGRLETASALAERHGDWLTGRERRWIEASTDAARAEAALERRRVRRLRSLLALVAVVAVVAILAGVVALVQRQRADEGTREADLRRVMAQSQAFADDDPNLALLLALEAHRLEPSIETLGAVVTAGSRAPTDWLGDIENGTAYRRVAFLDDGRIVATSDSTIETWDVGSRSLIEAVSSHEPISDLDVGADGTLAAIARSDGTWTVFDDELNVVAEGGVSEPVRAVRIHPDSEIVALGLEGGDVAVASFDGPSTTVLEPGADGVDAERGAVTGLAISDDGRRIAAAWGTPFGAQQWDLATDATAGTTVGTIRARLLDYADDVLYLVDSELQAFDVDSGRPVDEPIDFVGGATVLMRLEASDSTEIDVIGEGVRFQIDLTTGSIRERLYEPPSANAIGTVSPGRDVLAFATLDGLSFWSLDHRGVFVDAGLPAPEQFTQYNAISTDGGLALQGGNLRDEVPAYVWSLETGEPELRHVTEPGRGVRLTERDIVSFERTGDQATHRYWDRRSASFRTVAEQDVIGSTNPLLSIDRRSLLYPSLFAGVLDVRDIETGVLLHRLTDIEDAAPPGSSIPSQPRYSRDGRRLVLPATNEYAAIYDTETWQLIDLLEPPDGFSEVVFTPDGDRAITLSQRGLEIRDADDLRSVLLGPVPAENELALGRVLEITEDGRYLKLALLGGAQLIDASTLERIGEPIPHEPRAWAATLATETNQLATVQDGAMVIWNIELDEWPELACSAAGRNLTREEWDRFGPRGGYNVTCDQWPPG